MMRSSIQPARALAIALAVLAAWHVALVAAAEPERQLEPVLQEQIATDQAAIAAQERLNGISDETRELLLQYRQHLSEAKSLHDYIGQLSAQVASQGDEIEFIQKQLVEIEVTAREVMPLMQKMLDTLGRFVQLDVPFQIEERTKRVATLVEMMGRADVSISEKYRRIIEAYQIETEYGRTLEAYQAELGEGQGARTVRFLRIGRVALLYQTMDGVETGYWDGSQKKFVVDDSYRSAVKHGFEVADKVGAPDLLTAPVPAPVDGQS
jgi:septal ring factor EnvC (AmiA/AmiB activator)